MTDNTFNMMTHNGYPSWVGSCLYCHTRLLVEPDGTTIATIEHIVPRTRDGNENPKNLALVCKSCNNEKGRRQDKNLNNEHTSKFLAMRLSRFRTSLNDCHVEFLVCKSS